MLDGLVQLSVLDRDLTAPPGTPTDGDRYIVSSGATGDWAGWDLNIALWTDGAWLRLPPRIGWRAWVEDEVVLPVYDGASWIGTTPDALQNMALLGLGTTADPSNPAVLITHGTTGQAKSMLGEKFAGNLYGPGQPLDVQKYFLVLVDAIGAGESSKPSDGMRAAFPEHTLMDMVNAQKMLVQDGLGIDRPHVKIGFSMGGMLTWAWLTEYPDMMDGGVPIASFPGPMSGRNWMMRRIVIDAVRDYPAWNGGDYDEQPRMLRYMSAWFGMATSGGNLRLQELGATNEMASAYVDKRKAEQKVGDANDVMYMWNASRNFDPTPKLGDIAAKVLFIVSQDDERNPVELPMLEDGMSKVPDGDVYIVPESAETTGHGTTYDAAYYAEPLAAFLRSLPNAPK